MRKPFFRHLDLEPLEDRTLTNMPLGQLGTPVVGFSSIGIRVCMTQRLSP